MVSPWPGWGLRRLPLALVLPLGGGVFVAGHPDPGETAVPVDPGSWEAVLGPVAWQPGSPGGGLAGPSVTSLELRGLPTVFAVPGSGVRGLGPLLWAEAFRLFLRRRLHRVEPRLQSDYPLDDPVVSALATIEGRLLRTGSEAYGVALVRRERRAALADDVVAYEQAVEVGAGLPAYVAHRVSLELGGDPHPAWAALGELGVLSPQRRLEAGGLGLALLLDTVDPRWKQDFSGHSLDRSLESGVTFAGAEVDDGLLADIQGRFGYPVLLAAARDRVDQARAARRALVETILSGPGSLLSFHVGLLGAGELDPDGAGEFVHRNLVVYRDGVRFRYPTAELVFDDVPVAYDRRAGLLQARVPGRVRLEGDGFDLEPTEAAEFTSGFELEVRGLRVRATHGRLRSTDGGLYVELRP